MPQPVNGRAPTKVAQDLLQKDFTPLIGSLGYTRMISKAMLNNLLGEFDPEYIGYRRLYAMRRDPMIKMGLSYAKAPLIRSSWHIDCDDPAIAGALDEIIRNQYSNWMRVGLNKYDFGYQGSIKQFKLGQLKTTYEDDNGKSQSVWPDGAIKPLILDELIPVPPEFCIINLDPDTGEFLGFKATLSSATDVNADRKRTVPAQMALWWTNEFEENFRNYYGYPRSGYAFRYWWSYWFRHHMQDRHFEQDADPPLQVNYPAGQYVDPQTGDVIDHKEIALEIGEDLREGATIAVPSDFYTDELGRQVPIKKWELAFVKGGENMKAFLDSANYLDVMKLRSTLVPEQALMQAPDQPSARATVGNYQDIFKESLALEAEDNDAMFNAYVIPQLLEANWGPEAPPARKVTTGFDDDSVQLAQDLIKLAFQVDPNSIPINFEKLVKQANLPTYTAEEQQQREEEAAAEAAAQAAAANVPDPNATPAAPEPQQTPGTAANINAGGRYVQARGVIHLAADVPEAGRQAFARRQACIHATQSRIRTVMERRYERAFEAAQEYIADLDTNLGLAQTQSQNTPPKPRSALRRLLPAAAVSSAVAATSTAVAATGAVAGAIVKAALKAPEITAVLLGLSAHIARETSHYEDPITGELASLYHATGAAELQRLGMSQEGWSVAADPIQTWAAQRAGALVKTMDQTIVEQALRPFLTEQLSQDFTPEQIADSMIEKFKNYPHWMAERVARTEARTGFNQASIDLWDRIGLSEVVAYDGFGGKSGKSDPDCLARNGKTMTLAQARKEDAKEHPNGTLTFVPKLVDVEIPDRLPDPNHELVALSQRPLRSESIYLVRGGIILDEAETGQALDAAD